MLGAFRKLFRIPHDASAGWWVYERIAANWVALASLFGGGAMSYLAAITDWLDPWGPVGWGAAGIFAFILILGSLTLVQMGQSWKRSRDQLVAFTQQHLSAATVNPLQDNFDRLRIRASDFYHPFLRENHNKVFRNCEIIGPCNILLNGYTQMPRSQINGCEFVIIDTSKRFKTAAAFNNAVFLDCSFFRVTFFVHAEMARDLKAQIIETGVVRGTDPLNVITDGTYGEI